VRSTTHGTFTIDRIYRASADRVFRAWSDTNAKAQWFIGGDGWQELSREDDFRAGGSEVLVGRSADGTVTTFTGRYEEIVTNERIVFTYHMHHDDTPLSISLATVSFASHGTGTRLTYTEQLICLDGYEDPEARDRRQGTELHLARLDRYLNASVL
jgi:uncharacterized protein YndB with AHSA1/START domain